MPLCGSTADRQATHKPLSAPPSPVLKALHRLLLSSGRHFSDLEQLHVVYK